MQNRAIEDNPLKITRNQSQLALSLGNKPSELRRSLHPRVTLEAMSPSQTHPSGAGLTICYGIHATPLGELLIASTPSGICNLHFVEANQDAEQLLRVKWNNATLKQDASTTQVMSDRLFATSDPASREPISLWVKGTDFQLQVWRALLTIPFGSVTTYQAIATAIGKPTASRAVGNAIGQNPIAYLIPCHRVIRESGALGGYYWGLERKARILAWERAIASELVLAEGDRP